MISLRFSAAIAVLAAAVTGVPATARAQAQGVEKGPIGVGIIIGEPTGISAKLYLDDDTAIDAAVGSAVVGGGIQVHADYLWHPYILTDEDSFVMPAYGGVGLRLLDAGGSRSESEFHIGVRGVVGLLFDFKAIPLDVFIEVAAVSDYVLSDNKKQKGLGFDLNGGAGVRYYF